MMYDFLFLIVSLWLVLHKVTDVCEEIYVSYVYPWNSEDVVCQAGAFHSGYLTCSAFFAWHCHGHQLSKIEYMSSTWVSFHEFLNYNTWFADVGGRCWGPFSPCTWSFPAHSLRQSQTTKRTWGRLQCRFWGDVQVKLSFAFPHYLYLSITSFCVELDAEFKESRSQSNIGMDPLHLAVGEFWSAWCCQKLKFRQGQSTNRIWALWR